MIGSSSSTLKQAKETAKSGGMNSQKIKGKRVAGESPLKPNPVGIRTNLPVRGDIQAGRKERERERRKEGRKMGNPKQNSGNKFF